MELFFVRLGVDYIIWDHEQQLNYFDKIYWHLLHVGCYFQYY